MVAVSGILSQVWRAQQLLAGSTTYQAIVGAATSTDALETISQHEIASDDFVFPCALVMRGEDWARRRMGVGLFRPTGTILMCLWIDIPSEYGGELLHTRGDQLNYIETRVGSIIGELEALQGTGSLSDGKTHLSFTEIAVSEGPFLPTDEERGDLEDPELQDDGLAKVGFVQLSLKVD